MSDSKIEWTEQTWNPVTGCTKISPGCKFCYAEVMAQRLQAMGAAGYARGFALTLHEVLAWHGLFLPRHCLRPGRCERWVALSPPARFAPPRPAKTIASDCAAITRPVRVSAATVGVRASVRAGVSLATHPPRDQLPLPVEPAHQQSSAKKPGPWKATLASPAPPAAPPR